MYLLAFIAAELITFRIADFAGIIFNFAILLSLIINSAVNKDEAQRKLWLALGLVPLIRIVGLAMPLPEISKIFWYILTAIPVLAGTFIVSRALKFSFVDVGLNWNKGLAQIFIAVSGIVLGLMDYLILKPAPLNNQLTFQFTLIPALILIIATGFTEELAFRGVMQRAIGAFNAWGFIYIALIYAVLQIGRGSIWHCIFAFGVGIFYGWSVKKTGSILGVAFSHGLLNIALYLVLPHLL